MNLVDLGLVKNGDRAKRAVVLSALLAVSLCAQAFGLHHNLPAVTRPTAIRTTRKPTSRRAYLRRVHWDPVFRPSRDSLLRQNAEIDRLELPRIQDDNELEQLKASEDLVPIVPGQSLRIASSLESNRRYCRPWTRDFLQDLSEAYYNQFHSQIQVNSAVRTVKVQKKLRRHNHNAAPAEGAIASSHLAGVTVDIQRRGMTRQQIQWMQQYMLPMKNIGLIEPEEERRQWVFHVMVSDRYTDWREAKMLAGDPEEQSEAKEEVPAQEQ